MPLPHHDPCIDTLRGLLHTALNFLECADFSDEDEIDWYKERHAELVSMAHKLISEDLWGSVVCFHADQNALKLCKIAHAIAELELTEREETLMRGLG